MKVLLADDSDLMLERLKEILFPLEQVEIIACMKNGTETLEALKVLKPDVAIIDIKMPGLNGLEVLNEIRKENKALKIIILTLFPTDYFRELASLAGADYFFSKADEFEEVSAVIRDLIIKSNTNSEFKIINQ